MNHWFDNLTGELGNATLSRRAMLVQTLSLRVAGKNIDITCAHVEVR